jgi:hypothetical protein
MPTEDEHVDGVPRTDLVALLSVPPEEFVAARTARVKELRTEGRRDEAAALARVRKPVRLVWAVGEVARRDPELAIEAAAAAVEAEAAMAGNGDIRAALARYREVTGRVSAASGKIDRAVDRASLELALRQVLSDPAARTAWLEGWLVELPTEGSAPDEGSAPADELAPRRARRAAAKRKTVADTDADADARQAEADELAAEQQQREQELELARSRLAEATAALAERNAEHARALGELADARKRVARVEAEAADAEREAADTAASVAAAEQHHAETEAAVDQLNQPAARRPSARR